MRSCEVSKLRGGLSKNLRSEVAKVLKLRSCEVAGRVVKKSEAKLAKLRSCDVAKLQNWINVPTAPLYCIIKTSRHVESQPFVWLSLNPIQIDFGKAGHGLMSRHGVRQHKPPSLICP